MATLATPLGYNPFSAIKAGARQVYRVASDPRAQQIAVVAGKAYAPDKTASAQRYIAQGQQLFRTHAVTPPPGPAVVAVPIADDDDGSGAGGMRPSAPVQNSHFIAAAAIAGGVLLIALLLRK